MQLTRVLLNIICIQLVPPPEGVGFTDPLYDSRQAVFPHVAVLFLFAEPFSDQFFQAVNRLQFILAVGRDDQLGAA
jgi:hypothetical protein